MAAFSTIALAGLTAAQGIGQFAAQRKNARAVERSGAYEQQQAEINARLQLEQAREARQQGAFAATRIQAVGRNMVGSQRARLAAQGLDTTSGSALDLQDESRTLSDLDAMSIRSQAALEAWGFEVSALDTRSRGAMAATAAGNTADAMRTQSWGTLLTTGASLAGQSRDWRPRQKLTPRQRAAALKASNSLAGYFSGGR